MSDRTHADAHAHASQTAAPQEQEAHARVEGAQAGAQAAVARMAAPAEEPAPVGSEVWVRRPLGYHHAGVYVGNGKVVQVAAEPVDMLEHWAGHKGFETHIDEVPLAEFLKGGTLVVRNDKPAFPPDVVVQRALSKVGSGWNYDPLNHNCQTFASWCVTGVGVSPEGNAIENILNTAESGVGGVIKRIESFL